MEEREKASIQPISPPDGHLWAICGLFSKKFGTFQELSYFYKLEIKDVGDARITNVILAFGARRYWYYFLAFLYCIRLLYHKQNVLKGYTIGHLSQNNVFSSLFIV
jgi:hypothetical protein